MGRTSDAKDKLLQVAFDLIHTQSYNAVGVEQICTRAGVNKGSFYYYFKTKTDLAAAAYETHWHSRLSLYERVFAPDAPPLDRFRRWCVEIRAVQRQWRKKYGHVCGCPYASLGSELAAQDQKMQAKTRDLLNRHVAFLTGAVADAQAAKLALPGDPETKARLVHAFMIGLLLRAKIFNDLKCLDLAEDAIFALIGAPATNDARQPASPTR